MTKRRGRENPWSRTDIQTLALGVFGFILIYLVVSTGGIVIGLLASDATRFSLSVAGDHLRSAWECVAYALRVW